MLKEYLYNKVVEEKEVIETLLAIDNQKCFSNLTYQDILILFSSFSSLRPISGEYNFITSGEIKDTLNIILNYSVNILNLHINRCYVAINMYLVMRCNDYFKEVGIDREIHIDIEPYLTNYVGLNNLIIVGDKIFTEEVKELLIKENPQVIVTDN